MEEYIAEIIGVLISSLVAVLIMYVRSLANNFSTWSKKMEKDQGNQWSHINKNSVDIGRLQGPTGGD